MQFGEKSNKSSKKPQDAHSNQFFQVVLLLCKKKEILSSRTKMTAKTVQNQKKQPERHGKRVTKGENVSREETLCLLSLLLGTFTGKLVFDSSGGDASAQKRRIYSYHLVPHSSKPRGPNLKMVSKYYTVSETQE